VAAAAVVADFLGTASAFAVGYCLVEAADAVPVANQQLLPEW
jgi:hypothetical protein